jgi:hypothetical protein
MNRTLKNLLILLFFAILWTCKPISYQDLVRNQSIREKTIVLTGGQQDSRGKSSIDDPAFVNPIRDSQLSNRPDVRPDLQPKVDQSQARKQKLPKLKVRYATPDDGDPGGFGAGNINEDLPEIPYLKDTISDPEFWDTILGEETEDESTPAEQMPTTPPTKQLTKESLKKNDSVTENIQPYEFYDWEGKKRVIKSKELKNAAFSHGLEAGTSGPKDLVECPIQPDPNKFQRENCSKVTDETVQNLSDKIVDVTTAKSTKIGRVKFETKMPYFDSQTAIGHMDIITGDCFFYHKNGKFWTYKKYSKKEIPDLLMDVQSSLKWASDSSSPKFEL